MTNPATQPEAPVEPQQPATEHSGGPCCIGNVSPKGEYVAIETEHGEALYSHRDAVHAAEQLLAAAHTVTGEPQQPATAPLSDAQRQREYWRDAEYNQEMLAALHQRAENAEAMANDLEAETVRLKNRAEIAEMALEDLRAERDRLLTMHELAVDCHRERLQSVLERAEQAEQERNALREHIAADHQVLAQVRELAWNTDDGTTNPAVSCSQLLRVLNGDTDE